MEKIKLYSSEEQTKKINEILGENHEQYSLADVFNILPNKVKWGERIGYLRISKIDISYSSLETEMKGQVALLFQYLLKPQDIFDGFIAALKFFKEFKDEVEILEK